MRILKKKKKIEVFGSLVNILPSGIHLEASQQFLMLPLVLELETSSSSCEVCTCSQGTPSCAEPGASPPPRWKVSSPAGTAVSTSYRGVWRSLHDGGQDSWRLVSVSLSDSTPWRHSAVSWCALALMVSFSECFTLNVKYWGSQWTLIASVYGVGDSSSFE